MLLGPQCLPVPELYVRLPVGLSRHLSGRQPGSTQVTVLARLCQDVQVHAAKLRPLMVQSPHPLSQMPVLAKSTSRPRQMILELVQPLPHGQGLVDACVRWREALHADTLGSEPTPHVQWDLELQTDVDCGHVILAQHLSKRVLHVLLEVDTLLRDGRDALLEGSESHQLVQCLGQVLHLSRRDAQASRIDNGSVPCVPTEDIDDTTDPPPQPKHWAHRLCSGQHPLDPCLPRDSHHWHRTKPNTRHRSHRKSNKNDPREAAQCPHHCTHLRCSRPSPPLGCYNQLPPLAPHSSTAGSRSRRFHQRQHRHCCHRRRLQHNRRRCCCSCCSC
mmetsp:Transcript_97123/g.313029  ORF Transcript_97123/g.313029 Transcript_97123/m.313029 type:complete len:331 (-) Transcript_97123:412-1404(-)